jgi:alpha-tubulin suppressor-like RCC1 family protein
VRCWGLGASGALGEGTTTNRLTPSVSRINLLTNMSAVAVGYGHACGLRGNGTVRCWGENGSGQLGDLTTIDRLTPVTLSIGSVTQIAAGSGHTCVVIVGGDVACWGANSFGQIGNGAMTASTSPVVLSSFTFNVDPTVVLEGRDSETTVTVLAIRMRVLLHVDVTLN